MTIDLPGDEGYVAFPNLHAQGRPSPGHVGMFTPISGPTRPIMWMADKWQMGKEMGQAHCGH